MARTKERSFGQVLRDRRRQLDLTQEEVARRIKTSTPYIGHLESAKRHPSDKIVTRLAEVLGLDRRELFFLGESARAGTPQPGARGRREVGVGRFPQRRADKAHPQYYRRRDGNAGTRGAARRSALPPRLHLYTQHGSSRRRQVAGSERLARGVDRWNARSGDPFRLADFVPTTSRCRRADQVNCAMEISVPGSDGRCPPSDYLLAHYR